MISGHVKVGRVLLHRGQRHRARRDRDRRVQRDRRRRADHEDDQGQRGLHRRRERSPTRAPATRSACDGARGPRARPTRWPASRRSTRPTSPSTARLGQRRLAGPGRAAAAVRQARVRDRRRPARGADHRQRLGLRLRRDVPLPRRAPGSRSAATPATTSAPRCSTRRASSSTTPRAHVGPGLRGHARPPTTASSRAPSTCAWRRRERPGRRYVEETLRAARAAVAARFRLQPAHRRTWTGARTTCSTPIPPTSSRFCRERISRYVTLLHDYPLYEWTIAVRLDPEHREDPDHGRERVRRRQLVDAARGAPRACTRSPAARRAA